MYYQLRRFEGQLHRQSVSGTSRNDEMLVLLTFFVLVFVLLIWSLMGLVRITSWYPNFNGSHFGLPPSEIHRMTGLPPKIV